VPKASRPQIVASTISNASFWKDVQKLRLTVNMRLLAQAANMTDVDRERAESFAAWLLHVGNGTLNGPDDSVEIPDGNINTAYLY
jgi:hypothetical protein